jgi:hypothetical protein
VCVCQECDVKAPRQLEIRRPADCRREAAVKNPQASSSAASEYRARDYPDQDNSTISDIPAARARSKNSSGVVVVWSFVGFGTLLPPLITAELEGVGEAFSLGQ